MVDKYIEINNCRHYFINSEKSDKLYCIDSSFYVIEDVFIKHPFGKVYKPKNCTDTLIRFVRQKDKTVLMFKANEWNTQTNPFYTEKKKLFSFTKLDELYDKYLPNWCKEFLIYG